MLFKGKFNCFRVEFHSLRVEFHCFRVEFRGVKGRHEEGLLCVLL